MKCSYCKKIPNHECSVCGKYVCNEHSSVSVICKYHLKGKTKTKISIREGGESDKDALENMDDPIMEHQEVEDEAWEAKWEGIKVRSLVAEVDGEIAGVLEYFKTADAHECVSFVTVDFAVFPKFQRMGVGKALFDELKKIAEKSRIEKIYANTSVNNTPTIMFHLKNGAEINDVAATGFQTIRWGIKSDKSISFTYRI